MADYYQVKNQNIFNPPANTFLGNATNQYNSVYVQNDLVLGNVTVTGATIIAPRISSIAYPGDDTAADTAGGQTITLNGTGFVAGASVLINGSAVGVVSVVSSTVITFTSPANTTGSYVVYVVNPDGSTAIAIPGIQYSGTPNWTTAAGTLGNVYETASFNQTVTATGDAPITYSVASGSIPPGSTFNSNGTITGTSQLSSSPTTYSFTVRATDAQLQDTDRAFSIAVIPDVVTWSSPTNNTTYSPATNVAIANITLSATSAVGSGITYSANTLPTGLSLTGANISGTPTVQANTSSLLTATANTTSESSSITINWSVSVASDPYFMYNSLLLPGNGSNGAQNNTFLDSSTNNFAITRAGNTTQGTFSPYGPNWSNYFDGAATSYIQTPAGSTTAILGTAGGGITPTATFTIECWIYQIQRQTALTNPVLIGDQGVNGSLYWTFGPTSTGKLAFYHYTGTTLSATGNDTIPLNTWTHIAVSISSGFIKLFVNGTLQTITGTSTTGAQSGTFGYLLTGGFNTFTGGYAYIGYLSNLRIVKSALYSTTFTPSTTPLTPITNTGLLMCQSSRVIDNSPNAFTLTTGSTLPVQRFSPFSPTQAYSAGTTGGSGYFDGSGDYLSAANNAAYNLNSVSFTVECWIYWNSISGEQNIVEQFTPASGPGWALYKFSAGTIDFYGGTTSINSGVTPVTGQWYHLAISRNNSTGTTSFYVNGTRTATATFGVASTAATELLVGVRKSGTTWFNGYMEDLRIVKGSYVYNPTATTITVPTAPLTAITNTSLLLNYTNAGIIDNTMMNDFETVGDAKISTAQSKFGGSSMFFDGINDHIQTPIIPPLNTGNFTIEFWIYPLDTASRHVFSVGTGWSSATGVSMIQYGGNYAISCGSYGTANIGQAVVINGWHHIAIVRNNTAVQFYYDGALIGSGTDSSNLTDSRLSVGYAFTGTWGSFYGYMDDFRITKGYARYTSNFTPPTSAFPTY